jgi:hypothetical protein
MAAVAILVLWKVGRRTTEPLLVLAAALAGPAVYPHVHH